MFTEYLGDTLHYSFLDHEEFTVEWACQVCQEKTLMQQSVK